MRLEMITGLRILIIAFISYIATITFAGWFESLIAKKVGDDAPEQSGFLTLNPLEHFNVFGFAALLWSVFFANLLPFQFIPGWGRYIPLVPDNIRGSYYKLRIFIEYIGRSFAHLIIIICVATAMMLMLGMAQTQNIQPMLTSSATSFKEVLAPLLYFIFQQNIILFVIHFIIGVLKYLIYFHMPRLQEISFITMIFAFLFLVVVLSIFGPLLEIFVFKLIEGIQSLLLLVMK
ncbi:MAG: hypothetical protein JO129_03725 [Candidatus Dependentiae bacterium]|nr:hypothetical protein [Candidatus Dependentiae bacterium]